MTRLPQVGSDDGTWGAILNDFLSKAHDSDGSLKTGGIITGALGDGVVTEAKLDSAVQTKLNAVGSGTTPSDGSVTTVKLANDAVTNAKVSPTAAIDQSKINGLTTSLSSKEPTITAGTTGQYWRGDKSFQTLDKTAVGLANVDNTTDAGKPVSTATQTALNLKEPSITAGSTAQYWRGDKSWQTLDKTAVGLANVNNTTDANKPISTATQTALDLKADTADIGPQFLVLGPADTVPLGTAAGTVIVRTT